MYCRFLKHNDRHIFIFENLTISFEDFATIIDTVVKPNSKTDVEITSWTESFVFTALEISIYFEYFYDPDNYFSFELYPIGCNNEKKQAKLVQIVDRVDKYISNL